jgi:hypothetical protein
MSVSFKNCVLNQSSAHNPLGLPNTFYTPIPNQLFIGLALPNCLSLAKAHSSVCGDIATVLS